MHASSARPRVYTRTMSLPPSDIDLSDSATRAYRIGRLEAAVEKLDDQKADKEFVSAMIGTLRDAVTAQTTEVTNLRHTIVMAATGVTTTIVGSVVALVIAHLF